MAKLRSWSPIAFLPTQVSIIGTLVYLVLFILLLLVHLTVPPAPTDPNPASGINLTQSWRDLQYISSGYHPWGSQQNDAVRQYLLARVEEILAANQVPYETVVATPSGWQLEEQAREKQDAAAAVVFATDSSNFTSLDDWTHRPLTAYGESDNILVYIRGKEDKSGDWWNETTPYDGTSGVLVNAHFDSVQSGRGATDDGVGVVTVLQLISHFTAKGNQPKRGVVALLNNGEENGLYGARSYVRHPLASFTHTFLNLEGAGAGGRAILFRSTDAEVTKAYSKSPHPFGTVVSGDGFKRGFIRSGTDYSVFQSELGLRGLDVAFYSPRSRYHSDQDSSQHTSPASVWHMLSAALATMQGLTSHQGTEFEGSPDKNGKLDSGASHDSFYFDILGLAFAVGKLNTLFALSVTLLVAGPMMLILFEVLIRRSDKWYIFAGKRYLHSSDDDEAVRLHGRRGFFRFPISFVISTAVAILLALLQSKLNPYVIYSSEYTVFAMFLAVWVSGNWFLIAGASEIRPTALHRMFCLIWLYVVSWLLLVVATVGEHQIQIASGYPFVIYNATVWVALLLSYLELLALPKMSKYVEHVLGAQNDSASIRAGSVSSRRLLADTNEAAGADPTERSPLLQQGNKPADQHSFIRFNRHRADINEVPEDTDDPLLDKPYMDEQAWSSSLPQWTWVIQLLVLAVPNVIVIGQVALMIVSATHQTPADGNPVLPVYLFLAGFSILLLLPLAPFLHRFTFHVPTFLFFVFIGCLIYNLLAFPFSTNARLKYYFVQQMNLDTGSNNVTVLGLDGYIQDIIAEMPSADGKPIHCDESDMVNRNGLLSCRWEGLMPNVVPRGYKGLPANSTTKPKHAYRDWLEFNITSSGSSATIAVRGVNSKQCRLSFETAVTQVHVEDSPPDPRQPAVGTEGSTEVRLFGRTWDKRYNVTVTWPDGSTAKGQKGRVWCLWSDANEPGVIPAFDELHRFEPAWSAVTKASDGLVEGFKEFEI